MTELHIVDAIFAHALRKFLDKSMKFETAIKLEKTEPSSSNANKQFFMEMLKHKFLSNFQSFSHCKRGIVTKKRT